MTEEEIAEVVIIEEEQMKKESATEKNVRFLQKMLAEINKMYPQKLEEGVTMKRVYLDGDYVVYVAECDDDAIDMDLHLWSVRTHTFLLQ